MAADRIILQQLDERKNQTGQADEALMEAAVKSKLDALVAYLQFLGTRSPETAEVGP